MSHKNAPGQGALLYTVMKNMGGTISGYFSIRSLLILHPLQTQAKSAIFKHLHLLGLKNNNTKSKQMNHISHVLCSVIVNHI